MNKKVTTTDGKAPEVLPASAPLNKNAIFGDKYLYISGWKVLFMSFFPGYMFVWVWRNWRIYRARQQSHKGIFFRTLFFPFMLYPLFKDMFSNESREKPRSAVLMALYWLPGIVAGVLKFTYPSLSVLAIIIGFFPLLVFPVAQSIINKHALKPVDTNDGYKFQHMTWLNYFAVVIGIFIFVTQLFFSGFDWKSYFAKQTVTSWTTSTSFSSLSKDVHAQGPATFCAITKPVVSENHMITASDKSCHSVMKPIVHECAQNTASPSETDKLASGQAKGWVTKVMSCSMAHYFSKHVQYHSNSILSVATHEDIAKHCAEGSKDCVAKRGKIITGCYDSISKQSKIPNLLSGDQLGSYLTRMEQCAGDSDTASASVKEPAASASDTSSASVKEPAASASDTSSASVKEPAASASDTSSASVNKPAVTAPAVENTSASADKKGSAQTDSAKK